MPTHIDTIEISKEEMERGAREEAYSKLLREWRKGQLSDDTWAFMVDGDKELRTWLFDLGS